MKPCSVQWKHVGSLPSDSSTHEAQVVSLDTSSRAPCLSQGLLGHLRSAVSKRDPLGGKGQKKGMSCVVT